jgi:HKD family nuclease
MDVKFLSSKQTLSTLIELTKSCEQMQWAVAWGTANPVFEAAMEHSTKFKHFVIGTHLFQTHPVVLERASSLQAAAVMPPTGDLFHPKVYLFRNGRRIRGVVGSPNLTLGAMTRNIEASVLLDGTDDDEALVELCGFVERAYEGADDISPAFLFSYQCQWEAKQATLAELTKFVNIRMPKQQNSVKAPQAMSWETYLTEVRSSAHPSAHLFKERLMVLQRARELFARDIPFSQWDEDDRKRVAGLLGRRRSQPFRL